MKLGSLFDGSGGFPLAGSLCGIEPVWAAEVEPYPIAVTKSRFPKMKHWGNICNINGAEIEPVDIITFGSPCQDLSVAGKRAGLKHEDNGDEETTRSGLFMEAVRIIKEMRSATNGRYPTFALWENVPGAFSSNQGEDFRIVLQELIQIAEPTAKVPAPPKGGWAYADIYLGDGWSLAYRVFDAQYWGVPQRRRRIHLIADFRGGRAGEVLFKSDGLQGHPTSIGEAWQGTAGDASDRPGAADREGENGCIAFHLLQDPIPNNNVSPCMGQGNSDGGQAPIGVCYSIENHPADSRVDIDESGKVQTLTSRMGTGGGNVPMVLEAVGSSGDIAGTLDASYYKGCGMRQGVEREVVAVPIVCEPVPIHDQATRFSGKRGDKDDGKGNGLGIGAPGDPMNTLTSGDRHAVVYAIDQQGGKGGANYAENVMPTICSDSHGTPHAVAFKTYQKVTGPLMANSHPGSYTGQDAFSDMLVAGPKHEAYGVDCRNMNEYPELYPTLQAKSNGGQSLNFSGAVRVRYIVRRLTPTECARLQGFPDKWGHPDPKTELTDEEYAFWTEVRATHAVINGKEPKTYSKEQILKWYNGLHTDSAEYKMWGNGIALPPALYCMQGIAQALGVAT